MTMALDSTIRSTAAGLLFLAATSAVQGFLPTYLPSYPQVAKATSSTTSLHALGVFVRKAKENDIRTYCQEGPSEDVLTALKLISDAPSDDDAEFVAGPVQTALSKRKGTLSIVAEYKRKLDSSGYMSETIPAVVTLGPVFREFGASACAVAADERFGGCTYVDLADMVKEQAGAQGEVPGPLPVISSDRIVDEIQIARAKVSGAAAVMVSYEMVGKEKVAQFVKNARGVGLETIVEVRNKEEASDAVEAGATLLCVVGAEEDKLDDDAEGGAKEEMDDIVAKYAVVSELVEGASPPICTIINILANDNKAMEEVTDAWKARDIGFNAAWVSDALYKGGNDPVEHPGAVIQSMTAKSSVKFASPKARSGKGEGAREYLGDIMM